MPAGSEITFAPPSYLEAAQSLSAPPPPAAPFVDRQKLESEFLAQLPAIEQLARSLCRRYGLDHDETEDFVSTAKLKIVENDYAVLQKFRGDSSIKTYLAVVIATLMRERHVQIAGRWRPSAEARRLGSWAVRLETLVYRNGFTLREAGQQLRAGGLTTLSDRELSGALSKLPRRTPPRTTTPVTEVPLAAPARDGPDTALLEQTKADVQRTAESALEFALDTLPPEDRVMVRLVFCNGMSVADTARILAVPQKPIYRRLPRLLESLRVELESAGVTTEHIRDLIHEADD